MDDTGQMLSAVLAFVTLAGMFLAFGSFAFVRWLLSWASEREDTYLRKLNEISDKQAENNQLRDEILRDVAIGLRKVSDKVDTLHEYVMSGKGAGSKLR